MKRKNKLTTGDINKESVDRRPKAKGLTKKTRRDINGETVDKGDLKPQGDRVLYIL
jgi:hypothetical protein